MVYPFFRQDFGSIELQLFRTLFRMRNSCDQAVVIPSVAF